MRQDCGTSRSKVARQKCVWTAAPKTRGPWSARSLERLQQDVKLMPGGRCRGWAALFRDREHGIPCYPSRAPCGCRHEAPPVRLPASRAGWVVAKQQLQPERASRSRRLLQVADHSLPIVEDGNGNGEDADILDELLVVGAVGAVQKVGNRCLQAHHSSCSGWCTASFSRRELEKTRKNKHLAQT